MLFYPVVIETDSSIDFQPECIATDKRGYPHIIFFIS